MKSREMFTCGRLCVSVLATLLGLIQVGKLSGQIFNDLYDFTALSGAPPVYTNVDGIIPLAELVLSSNILYGTASGGGGSGNGTVLAVDSTGGGFISIVHTFTTFHTNSLGLSTNSDGAFPYAGLLLSGNTLYGTANIGGSSGKGTVFAVNVDGTGFTNLHTFTGGPSDGALPYSRLVLSGSTLYGTTQLGGKWNSGTLFAVSTNATEYTNLYSFSMLSGPHNITNSDGAQPRGGLIISGDTLYGTATAGGASGGSVFRVNTDGTGFTNLHSFAGGPNEGTAPYGALTLCNNTLYGTTFLGGGSGNGAVFAIETDGSSYTNLHSFAAKAYNADNIYTNSDGIGPAAGLVLWGNTLYGTTAGGGAWGCGTVFSINKEGTGFLTLRTFTGELGGARPKDALLLSDNTLYGTLSDGGVSGYGMVFSLAIQPILTISSSGASVILTWPSNFVGFTLESSTNPVAPALWTASSVIPVVAHGQNTVTNAISDNVQFYRLSSN